MSQICISWKQWKYKSTWVRHEDLWSVKSQVFSEGAILCEITKNTEDTFLKNILRYADFMRLNQLYNF